MFFRAHLTGVKISLDFGTESLNDASKSADKLKTNDNEDFLFPRYLATGSSDRVFAIWDLSDGVTAGSMGTIVPIRQFRRHLIRYLLLNTYCSQRCEIRCNSVVHLDLIFSPFNLEYLVTLRGCITILVM